jgi:large subunit ribosomal protein L35
MNKIKVKTSSSAKKRFKKVGGKNVKIKRGKAFRRHLLTKKTSKRKRQLRAGSYVSSADFKRIIVLLPN